MTIKPVHIDGTLYVCIAMFLAIQSEFGSDEAYKYVSPYTIFWIKFVCAVVGAGAGALKMFRSREYADHADATPPLTNPPVSPTIQPTSQPTEPKTP